MHVSANKHRSELAIPASMASGAQKPKDCEELSPDEEQDTIAKLAVMLLSISWTSFAALRTVLDLDIPRILATHAPNCNGAMTAQGILSHVPGALKPNATALERVLRLLTCKSVFSEDLNYSGEEGVVRRFALTPLSMVLVPGHKSGTTANFVTIGTVGVVYGKAMEHLRCDTHAFNAHSLNVGYLLH